MSLPLTIPRVRTQIADLPKWNATTSAPPEMIGYGDGTRTVYQLKFRRAVLSSVDVEFGVMPSVPNPSSLIAYQSITFNDASNPWTTQFDANGLPQVRFLNPPPQGKVIGVRYLVTRFTDPEIQAYIDANDVNDTEVRALQAVQVAMIPADLSDPDRMLVKRIGDTSFDSSQYQRTQLALMQQLLNEIKTSPAATGPAFAIGRIGYGRL